MNVFIAYKKSTTLPMDTGTDGQSRAFDVGMVLLIEIHNVYFQYTAGRDPKIPLCQQV